MLPADWAAYMAGLERDIAKRPENAPGRSRPVKKMQSARQRRASTGTRSSVKSIYQDVNEWNQAQTIDPTKTTFTTNLGGNCEPDAPHGKSTQSRQS
jgi:hypothetical protein